MVFQNVASLKIFPQRVLLFVLLAISAMHTISPIADLLLAHKLMNLAFLLGTIGFLICKKKPQLGYHPKFLALIKYCFGALLIFCLLHAVVTPGSWAPDLRYFLLLLIGYLILIKLSLEEKEDLFSKLTWLFASYFLYMMLVHGMLHAGWFELEDWAAKSLPFLSDGNPIWIRDGYDFEYYFPFYSVVIAQGAGAAIDVGGYEILRLTGPFMEPTDVAFVTVPLMFYTWGKLHKNAIYWVPVGVFSMVILWSFAASGLVAIGISILLYFASNHRSRGIFRETLKFISIIFIFGVGILAFINFEYLINLFGAQKLAQFHYFKEQILLSENLYLRPSAFGLGFENETLERTYGILAVLVRHGWAGAVLLLGFLSPLIICSWGLLKTHQPMRGAMGFAALVLFIKYPEIVNLFFLMIYVYVVHTYLASRKPVNRSKI